MILSKPLSHEFKCFRLGCIFFFVKKGGKNRAVEDAEGEEGRVCERERYGEIAADTHTHTCVYIDRLGGGLGLLHAQATGKMKRIFEHRKLAYSETCDRRWRR